MAAGSDLIYSEGGKLSRLIGVKLRHKVTGIQLETLIFVELLRVTTASVLEEPETIPKMLNMTLVSWLNNTRLSITRSLTHKASITHLSPPPHEPVTIPVPLRDVGSHNNPMLKPGRWQPPLWLLLLPGSKHYHVPQVVIKVGGR